jgi:hypothetical protein
MTNYTQFRLAKRNGEIVQQKRSFTANTRSITPWWKFWPFWEYEFVVDTEYGEWEDVPWVEL